MMVGLRSRRHIAPFTLQQPTSVPEATAMRAASGTAAYLAGGIELIDWMKQGHAVERVIRLDRISGLADISGDQAMLRIGAMATHAALADSKMVRALLPDLATLWHGIANPRVRYAGTIGGNVMAGKADYDAIPALLALGATAEIATGAHVAVDQLQALDQPLVKAFLVPAPTTLRLFADRTLRPALTVWAGLTIRDGRVTSLRVAIGMAHPTAASITMKLDLAMTSLGGAAPSIAAETARLMPEPISDGKASASYRRRMTEVLTRRILIRAGASA